MGRIRRTRELPLLFAWLAIDSIFLYFISGPFSCPKDGERQGKRREKMLVVTEMVEFQGMCAFCGPAFWQCLAPLAQSAHRCSASPSPFISLPGTLDWTIRPLIMTLLSALSHACGLLEDITIATSLLVCRRKLKAHLF